MSDLTVDPQIRTWVFLPIVLITFLAGLLRHYLTQLLRTDKLVDLEKVRDSECLIRLQLFRENGKYLTRYAFHHRKFNYAKEYSVATDNGGGGKTPAKTHECCFYDFEDGGSALRTQFFGNAINYMPMLLIGGWLMYQLNGFIITKIPFPLTLRFKAMLQKDIFLEDLEAEWVSSASWYFLNVFGLRSIYYLIIGENHHCSDRTIAYQYAANLPPNTSTLFKNEFEALELTKHQFALLDSHKTLAD